VSPTQRLGLAAYVPDARQCPTAYAGTRAASPRRPRIASQPEPCRRGPANRPFTNEATDADHRLPCKLPQQPRTRCLQADRRALADGGAVALPAIAFSPVALATMALFAVALLPSPRRDTRGGPFRASSLTLFAQASYPSLSHALLTSLANEFYIGTHSSASAAAKRRSNVDDPTPRTGALPTSFDLSAGGVHCCSFR